MREDAAVIRAEGEQGILPAAVQHVGATDMQDEMQKYIENARPRGALLCLVLPKQGQGNAAEHRETLGRRVVNTVCAVVVQYRFAVGLSDFPGF